MIIKIQFSHDKIEVIGAISENQKLRPIYYLTKIDGNWEVSQATMPSGNHLDSKKILEVSLKCHEFKDLIDYSAITNSFVYYG